MSKFLEDVIARAKSDKKTIVLAEGNDIRTIRAAASALEQEIADIIILGDIDEICKMANEENLKISAATLIDPSKDERFNEFVNTFYEMRKAKGMTPEKAEETMKNTLYFGCMMVKLGFADGMVAGACNSSANVLRSALQVIKTAPGTKLVSAFFIECVPNCEYGEDGVFLFADCGLNENPDAEAVSEIAVSSAKSFKTLVGKEPNVAMLCYSTYGSAKSELVDKMNLATKLAKEKAPDVNIDGEMQADAAMVPAVAASKAPTSPVAGKANVLVFPDLNAGNIAYKLVERLAKADAYGPITQGIAKPVNDLSRGCKAEDIVGVIAITCVQAQAQN
ncbi:MAG: phosphate acetyltransferase [Oscillospiraceae bacterium]|nr:phosphate acetyltransferase [Oscillospiraceae bacterium]